MLMFPIVVILLYCVFLNQALTFRPTEDYCKVSYCHKGPHIGCGHDRKYGTNCSTDARVIPMNDVTIKLILDKHNTIRNTVAKGDFNGLSPALRMATIIWDYELAYLAELNVLQCVMHLDACRNTYKYAKVGQNLVYKGFKGNLPNFQDIIKKQIDMWINEHEHVTMDNIIQFKKPAPGKSNTNFLQIIKENTNAVGCAILQQSINSWLQQFMVCNYAHINIINKPVYDSGSTPAEHCKTGTNSDYKYLCSVNENYDLSNTDGAKIDETDNTDPSSSGPDSAPNSKENPDKKKKRKKKPTEAPTQKPTSETPSTNSSPFNEFLNTIGKNLNNFTKVDIKVSSIGKTDVVSNQVKVKHKPQKVNGRNVAKKKKNKKQKN